MARRRARTVFRPSLQVDPALMGAVLWVRGDTGVVGDPIAQWVDQSGRGNHLTAATTYRPAVIAAGLGGKDGVRFDGVGNRMASPAVAWSESKRFTILVLSQRTGPGASAGGLVGSFGTGGTGQLLQTDAVYRFYDGSFDRTLDTHAESSPELKVIRRTANGTLNFRRGRVDIGNVNCSNWTEANTYPLYVGGYGNDSFWWGGDVYEVQVFPTALSDADVQLLEDDIYSRWGL